MNIMKYKRSLLLYSGNYNDESIQPFVTDSNFLLYD